jgi:Fur family transcriptional regulator, ferric uptake regulator
MIKISKKQFESGKILKDNHLKSTEQRIEILNVIISNSGPFSIQDIKNKLKKNIDLVTIYRFIDILKENKIISEVYNSEGTKYFEFSPVHTHPHFICKKCRKIFCIKDFLIDKDLEIKKELIKDYEVNSISINLNGICNSCINNR